MPCSCCSARRPKPPSWSKPPPDLTGSTPTGPGWRSPGAPAGKRRKRARIGCARLTAERGWRIDATSPSKLVLLREMQPHRDGLEITNRCWAILNKNPGDTMRASSRVVVKPKGSTATPPVPSSVCWVAVAARVRSRATWGPPPAGILRAVTELRRSHAGAGQTCLRPARLTRSGRCQLGGPVLGPASLVSVAQDASETEPPS